MHRKMNHGMEHGAYHMLAIMAVLSFISMYGLMYAMVNVFDNVFASLNQVYMAGLMTAPMIIIEPLLMRMMYPRKTLNLVIIGVSIVALIAFWILIRQQIGIGDKQFLRSMIPHHAGAILMCEQAPVTNADILKLCQTISNLKSAK